MPTEDALSRLKATYQAWNDTKGGDRDAWLDLMADDVRLHTIGDHGPGLGFARECRSKDEVVGYMTALLGEWRMNHFTPARFIVDGDQVAVFSRTAWTHRSTGKPVDVAVAHMFQFRDGMIVEAQEVFDGAPLCAAAV